MKKILIGLCLLFFAAAVQAQTSDTDRVIDIGKWKNLPHPGEKYFTDSLFIYGSSLQIEIAAWDLKYLTDTSLQLNKLVFDFQQYFASRKDQFPDFPRTKYTYSPEYYYLLKEELDSTLIYFSSLNGDKVRKYPYQNELIIQSPIMNIKIKYINDSVLVNPELQLIINEIVALKTIKEWKTITKAWATDFSEKNRRETFPSDRVPKITWVKKEEQSIEVFAATGFSSTRTSSVLSAELKCGYIWDSGGYDIGYYLSYDWNFSFAENGTRSINSFINLSGLEEGFLPRLKTMAGIDMGYLVFRQGDLYEKNTFRLGFGFKGDFWYFSPQMYFPGKFKGVYPGLRVLIGI